MKFKGKAYPQRSTYYPQIYTQIYLYKKEQINDPSPKSRLQSFAPPPLPPTAQASWGGQ